MLGGEVRALSSSNTSITTTTMAGGVKAELGGKESDKCRGLTWSHSSHFWISGERESCQKGPAGPSQNIHTTFLPLSI